MRLRFIVSVAALSGAAAAFPANAAAQYDATGALTPEQEQLLAAVHEATKAFADVDAALAAGYIADPTGMCVDAAMVGAPPELGAMGIHYFHPGLMKLNPIEPGKRVSGNAASYDPLKPEILVYEPRADGSRKLVAVEYLVFKDAWYAGGNAERPEFAGIPFEEMENDPATEIDEAHGFEGHYELHVWLYRDNPNGMFAEWNPAVTCPPAAEHAH